MISRVDIVGQNGNDGEHYEQTEFAKFDQEKAMHSLIPPECLELLAEQLTFGAKRYSPDNWKKGTKDRYYNAIMRHLQEMRKGQFLDEDERMHSQAVFTNAMFLLWLDLADHGIVE